MIDNKKKVDLSLFDNTEYKHGKHVLVYYMWHVLSALIFRSQLLPGSGIRIFLLKLFGAKIGKNVIFNKPNVNIKYPWKLTIGDNCWIGENSWIYNMDEIIIGDNVNVSQGVMLLTGNHNYKSERFEVFTKPITIEEGVFLGAYSIVCPGVTCESHSILSVGSIATNNLEAYGIYQGNPAVKIKERIIE